MIRLALGTMALLVVLLVACNSDHRISATEYIAIYCETTQADIPYDGDTIGESIQTREERADSLEMIAPPREFAAVHAAMIEFLRAYADGLSELGDDTSPIPRDLDLSVDFSPEAERRLAIAYAQLTLEVVTLPQPLIDQMEENCE